MCGWSHVELTQMPSELPELSLLRTPAIVNISLDV